MQEGKVRCTTSNTAVPFQEGAGPLREEGRKEGGGMEGIRKH